MSRSPKWISIALILVLMFLLFRMKAVTLAAAMGFVLGLAAFAEKMMRIYALHRAFKNLKAQAGQGESGVMHRQMTFREACDLLGLPENPTEKQVNEAYKKLMQLNHPDKGGSTALAALINQARDVVMEGISNRTNHPS